jgi:hypothetical protein
MELVPSLHENNGDKYNTFGGVFKIALENIGKAFQPVIKLIFSTLYCFSLELPLVSIPVSCC